MSVQLAGLLDPTMVIRALCIPREPSTTGHRKIFPFECAVFCSAVYAALHIRVGRTNAPCGSISEIRPLGVRAILPHSGTQTIV